LVFVNNSAGNCSISLRFGIRFDNVTSDLLQMFKVKRSTVKIWNSVWNYSISLKFHTNFGHLTPDVLQMFTVDGSVVKVTALHNVLA